MTPLLVAMAVAGQATAAGPTAYDRAFAWGSLLLLIWIVWRGLRTQGPPEP